MPGASHSEKELPQGRSTGLETGNMTVKPSGRVFVLGDNDLAGLAIVRSLGRSGLDVDLAVTQSKSITRHSRYVRRIHDLGDPLMGQQQFLSGLLEIVKHEQFDLVIPTSDKTLVPLLSKREEIGVHARLALPDEMGYQIAFHKNKTMDLARELGIPVPETQLLSVADDIDHLRGCEHFPIVLKPQFSTAVGTTRRNEVRIVESNEDLRQRLPEMLARSPVLVQSFCPGIGVGLSVLADQGELVAAFQHERVHEPVRRPVPIGRVFRCVTICWTLSRRCVRR